VSARALCWVCFSGERGFGYDPAMKNERGATRWFCSRDHQRLSRRRELMADWSEREEAMIWEGVRCGGEYLDELGKSDLAVLTKDELVQFAKCLLQRVVEERLIGVDPLDDEIPF
tara:strand:- start:340 stop:684 length:345 start_codon:yes stop_codon:yes gene_type:complete